MSRLPSPEKTQNKTKQGVCLTLKGILRQKKNYGNPLKETKILQDIMTR
jgi:hypothetical protein